MPTYDAAQAECFVFSFKDGLLSKIAHDLKIRVETLELTVDGDSVSARFDAGSLRVVCARKAKMDAPGTLGASDKKKIEKNIREDVLAAKKHRDITFVSTKVVRDDDGALVSGDLTLHGRTRAIETRVTRRGDRWFAALELDQRDFGITPFKAMLGTLKIQPIVGVELSIPAS